MQTELEKLCIFANRKGEKREMTDDEKRIFGQRLKALREMRGLSQADLAERMGGMITPQAIYKYEKGKMSPDSVVLIGLAEALGTSPDAFLRPVGMKVEGLAFRKQSSLGVKKQKAIVTMVTEAVNRYAEIEDILGLNEAFDKSPFAMPVSTLDDAKVVARRLREEWNLGEDGIAKLIPLLEDHHVRVIEIEGVEKFDGLSGWAGTMPIVIVKKEEDDKKEEKTERKRFTVLHELGHLVLNIAEGVEDKAVEKLCNQFANEVLLPESVVRKRLGDSGNKVLSMQELIELQKQFGISVDAIIYKLHEMGVLNDSRFSAHFRKKSNEAYKNYVDQSRIGVEHSGRFECLVYNALAKDLVSLSKAIELLGKPVEEVLEKALKI